MGREVATKYQILVDDIDDKCLTLKGKEFWPEDEFASGAKWMGEIIINAANYAAQRALEPDPQPGDAGYHYTFMDMPLFYEPRHPNPSPE